MNTHFSSRRGSALLIVLGMLAFMIVSAVGFAVYMRIDTAVHGSFFALSLHSMSR